MSKIPIDKYQNFFDTKHIKSDLKHKSIHGGISIMAGESISLALRLGSLVVLARILMPEHFGLISMVTALTAIVERFKDLGLSSATVQRNEITHEQVSTLFWINVGLGILIMLIVAALSQVIAWFYNDWRLVGITLAFSLNFLLGGLTIQHQALLRRQMCFGFLAWINILSTVFSIVIAIGLAFQGFGYWALVWKEVSRTAFIAVGTWLMCRWMPGLPRLSSGLRSMLKFGRDLTGSNIVYFFSRSLDRILIGKFWGAVPLGFYRQAYQLMLMPMNQLEFPVTYVSESTLSALQNEPDKYSRYYKKIIAILSFVSMPLAIYLCVFSENFICLFLGTKWIKTVGIFRILALAAFIQPVANSCGFVMVTCGKTKRFFWWSVMNALCIIFAFGIGVHWGPIGVAMGYTITTYAILVPSLWFSFRDTAVSVSLFFKAISLSVLSSLIMGILLILVSRKITWSNSFAGIVLSFLLAISFYLGSWMFIPGGKHKLLEYISYPLSVYKFYPILRRNN